MAYIQLDIEVAEAQKEALLALLEPLAIDAFEETDSGWRAYVPEERWGEYLERQLADVQAVLPFRLHRRSLADQNWNAQWESAFSPVRVGRFCTIRAPFHPSEPGTTYELVIHPKMAFGTGHHETIYLMVEQMEQLRIRGRRVLDFGCGTGLLAILAAKMGARAVHALDIEREACANTLENARLNEVGLEVFQGGLSVAPGAAYDIVLANITRNVITSHLPALFERTLPEGVLLLSGVLKKEELLLKTELLSQGFEWEHSQYRGDWICMRVLRP
jgi:ribosomal protein L11 methyltransferase